MYTHKKGMTQKNNKIIVKITVVKIIIIFITFLSTFFIPAVVFDKYIKESAPVEAYVLESNQGNVAGISTDKVNQIFEFNINSTQSKFILLGIGFITISFIILAYLYIDMQNYKKQTAVDYFE